MTDKKLLSNIVLLRVFAILVVVAGHAMIIYDAEWSTFTPARQSAFFGYLKMYINVFQMPLFIFVSGYVFAYINQMRDLQKFTPFIIGKFRRLIIPLFFVFLLFVLPIRELIQYAEYQDKSIIKILLDNFVLGKNSSHLWFLPTLFLIFILYYFFVFITKNLKKNIKLTVELLFFVILFGVSMRYTQIPTFLYLNNVAWLAVFFMLGYLVREHSRSGFLRKNANILLAVFGILQFLGIAAALIHFREIALIDYVPAAAVRRFSAICSVMFFYVLWTKIDEKQIEFSKNKFVKYIDSESYQIYLFHSPLMYIVWYFLADKNIAPILLFLLNFAAGLCGALLISFLIQKTKKLNLIIGK
ncbi:MAG: acyltransferase [Prevotellaceae bacterium]|jgi:surface polysaccharide O-acyltransferase-like enzyme|nr:acyltransferase [Prevotellaceae bacterium]